MSQNQNGTFTELGIASNLLDVLTSKGFTTPTPIQQQVIPGAIQGNDIIGIAQTGTGKTLAFVVPMLQRISKTKGRGLVIVPTRELAEQVNEEFKNIGQSFGLKTAIVIGGSNEQKQMAALRKKPHIIVATPGRLMDFLDRKIVDLSEIVVVTLDEADRMLDMGFLPSITAIMKKIPSTRQTMLFSATMQKNISTLANEFLHTPLRVEIAPQGTAAKNVAQELYIVPNGQKMALLGQVLQQYPNDAAIVFSRTKHGAKRIKQKLEQIGHTATEIHGNRTQAQRKKALDGFTKKRFRILVATDVAARGIDVDHLSLVINFDIPDNSLEDYVHRIGRTGRAGRFGRAITFATPGQKRDVRAIERIINSRLHLLELPVLPSEKHEERIQKDSTQPVHRAHSTQPVHREQGRRDSKRNSGSTYRRKRRGGGMNKRTWSGPQQGERTFNGRRKKRKVKHRMSQ